MNDREPVELDLVRSPLRSLLLILIGGGPTHGYELLEQVRDAGIPLADPGTLYRKLRGLERDGHVESWWEDSPSGPPRRTYALTRAGRDALRAEVLAMRSTITLLSALADRAAAVLRPIGR